MKLPTTKNDKLAHVIAFTAGLLVCIIITATSGAPIAWASTSYFLLGIPMMCIVIWWLVRSFPVRVWRWPLSMMLGQVFSAILYGYGAAAPVAIVYVTLLSAPQFLVAVFASRSVTRKQGVS